MKHEIIFKATYNDKQRTALCTLCRVKDRSLIAEVSESMAWIYPRQIGLRPATFNVLVRDGLATKRTNMVLGDLQYRITDEGYEFAESFGLIEEAS